jgi:hypothetical protein
MKLRNWIFLCISLVLLFSCNKKNENKNENNQQKTEQAGLNESLAEVRERMNNGLIDPVTEEEIIKEFIYINDKILKKEKSEIIFIEKANFGLSGGENWIVRLNDRGIIIYAISNKVIEKRFYLNSFNLKDKSDFNIMHNIPGIHIGSSTSTFDDFNGDGINEIFEYGFYGWGSVIKIWGYDEEKNKFVSFCEIPFKIIDKVNGPAPVEFMTYKEMYGFKVYYSNNEVAGGIGWVSDPDPNNYKWIFYTWDAEQKKYIEIGEVVE